MTATDAYTASFGERGSKYDQAMRLVPEARREEFEVALEALTGQGAGVLLDVPAGGGYLQRYLEAQTAGRLDYQAFEPVRSFQGSGATGSAGGLLPIPMADRSVDVVMSIAGVHHFPDKRPLFADLLRVTRPGGRLVLADVHTGSAVARFLDGYVNATNSTGHHGYYLDDTTLEALAASGWQVESAVRRAYHWRFSSTEQMSHFCHLLFDITHTDYARTAAEIEKVLGLDPLADGELGMRWELFVVSARRPGGSPL